VTLASKLEGIAEHPNNLLLIALVQLRTAVQNSTTVAAG
jgi:hypothetical protein